MKFTSLCVLTLLMAGCATAHPNARLGTAAASTPEVVSPASPDLPEGEAPLLSYLQRVREVSRRARPFATGAEMAERWSPDLADAIARFAAAPTVEQEVRLAHAYARAGILDRAQELLATAARRDPRESAAWDGLARIWRDWGFPQLGLGDAYRAVSADPRSPAARNTLGTILQYLGHGRDARAQFGQALALDSGAAYAQNNICYSWLLEGNTEPAYVACARALAVDPGFVPARNNLALAKAIDGDLTGAAEVFGEVGGEAASQYNLGIVYLSQRRYAAAADAFDRASKLEPALTLARVRGDQARQHAAAAPDGGKEQP